VAADAGISLTHMAMAFVLEHPAVTSAIIGPRTMEQFDDLLAGAAVRLDTDVLNRIDEIVPPGTSISGADPWQPRALSRTERRRGSD
jgi:aryl-alcohol dehydrogenase-like predicted oxidoreductase